LAFDSVPDRFDRRIREIEHRSDGEAQRLDEFRERRTTMLRNGTGLTSRQLWPRRSLSAQCGWWPARGRHKLTFLLSLSLDLSFAVGSFVGRISALAGTFAFTHSSRSA
jgi:hypothetical protein